MALGFLKTSDRASRENVVGMGATRSYGYKGTFVGGASYGGLRGGPCPGAVTTEAHLPLQEASVLFKFSIRGSIRGDGRIPT